MLLRELSDDEDGPASADQTADVPDDPNQPWIQDFRSYLDTIEHVPDDWTTIAWWGVCHAHAHVSLSSDIISEGKCTLLSRLGITGTGLPVHNGVLSIK
jgi:hypothetical protein